VIETDSAVETFFEFLDELFAIGGDFEEETEMRTKKRERRGGENGICDGEFEKFTEETIGETGRTTRVILFVDFEESLCGVREAGSILIREEEELCEPFQMMNMDIGRVDRPKTVFELRTNFHDIIEDVIVELISESHEIHNKKKSVNCQVGNEWKMKWVCGKGVSKWKEGGGNEIHFFSKTQKAIGFSDECTRTKCSTRLINLDKLLK